LNGKVNSASDFNENSFEKLKKSFKADPEIEKELEKIRKSQNI